MNFLNKHKDQTVYIVGKGFSLNYITRDYFGEGIVIAINEAIELIEPLNLPNIVYSLQKDLYTSKVKPETRLLLHVHESAKTVNLKEIDATIFDNEDLGLRIIDFSALTAIQLGRLMGCTKFVFIAFDSVVKSDLRTYLGVTPEWSDNYTAQTRLMKAFILDRKLNHGWICPTINKDLPKIALITPTGERPKQFRDCAEYMKRQNYLGEVVWIIVDDGRESTTEAVQPDFKKNWTIVKSFPVPKWKPGQNTQSRNLQEGIKELEKIKGIEYVFIIEDDDWYSECYLLEMVKQMIGYQLTAQVNTIYINVKDFTIRFNHNSKHGSLFQVGFSIDILNVFKRVVSRAVRFIDIQLFKESVRKNLFHSQQRLSIGIKGQPGRPGIGNGHKMIHPERIKLTVEETNQLALFVGQDYLKYLP